MSIDVGGWIEVRTPGIPAWKGIERLDSYIDRDNGMLECLFGKYRGYHFEPIAPGRGVPADASPEVREHTATWSERDQEAVDWIKWAELMAINWNEQAVTGYERFIRTKRGALVVDHANESRQHRERLEEVLDRMGGWPEDADEIEVDGAIYRRLLVSRGAVKSEDWHLLFHKMEQLAARYGPDGVRIIVWLIA